jgi:hypothetical protein
MTITDLIDYKTAKKYKVVLSDLKAMTKLVKSTTNELSAYSKYTPAQSILRTLQENTRILQFYTNQIETKLKEKKNDE